jgi:hypothetical protein
MKIGDLVRDPSGYHKGIGIIIWTGDDPKNSGNSQALCVRWFQGGSGYNTGCRECHVEVMNEI